MTGVQFSQKCDYWNLEHQDAEQALSIQARLAQHSFGKAQTVIWIYCFDQEFYGATPESLVVATSASNSPEVETV